MGFRGGGQIDPPQRILVFKYPSGDRVKNLSVQITLCSIDMVIRKSKFVAKTEFIDQSYVFKIYCLLFYHRFYRTYKQTHKHPNVYFLLCKRY